MGIVYERVRDIIWDALTDLKGLTDEFGEPLSNSQVAAIVTQNLQEAGMLISEEEAQQIVHRAQVVAAQCGHCICAPVKVGGKPTGTYNWNPGCPIHKWDERLQAQADSAVEWQRKAREARKSRGS